MVATVAALLVALAAMIVSLGVGDFPMPLSDVLTVLLGGQGSTRRSAYVVLDLRLPRALGALAVGAAFGLSGAIVQRVVRNPLASPDVVGINAGAAVVAVFLVVVLGAGPHAVALGALAGAVATAAAIYLLSRRRGVTGYRLVLVGIGVTAMLSSVTAYLLNIANIYTAEQAAIWLSGSLAGRTWAQVVPVLIALAVLLPVALRLAGPLRALELGDDLARALGTRAEHARAGLLLTAVALAAVATAAAGPIAFVALAAPQIARRLVRERGLALVTSAAVGAALLAVADLAARRLLAPVELPVGVLTTVLGAPLLVWLLARANHVGRTG
ncbi:ABC transporter permease [Paractinoplanes deccanensis]|uniref:ABC transporter permease n=1 Tax=Paractinoplanes deccanensis TaxID=113561 RepID=A0ABQ3XZJ9_9ACTN|nr:iron chelate uptake ABC transporter family permease subunit [Actinoplanes deccanensis]GID73167.1 ABC transporter permease [Actinoplanes deccanensis]